MKRLKKMSLRFRLTVILSLTALVIWGVSTAVAWWQVRKEVNEVFDAQQILFAQRLASSDLRSMLIEDVHKSERGRRKAVEKQQFDDDALAFAIFTSQGELLLSDGRNGESFHYINGAGFVTVRIADDDDDWRIFWLPIAEGRLVIAVGQELDYREDLINKMVFGQMWIWFASLPLLIALIIWAISRELRPLKKVSEQLRQRTPEDHTQIDADQLPKEILPLVENLNHFLERTATMLVRERRFTSDAAHELRSPLAALKIQTELAQMADDEPELRAKALSNLTQGIHRASQLIEQLLTLSRLDNLQALEGVEDIHWDKILPSLIGELYFNAEKRRIDLQFLPKSIPLVSQGQPLLLSLMVRNLIENGIKYCAEGSTIQVILNSDSIVVQDNGGGVEADDLAKLGQRFYRPAGQNEKGSGLGLSIVHRIAELHHYRVQLENGELNGQKGLKVTLYFDL